MSLPLLVECVHSVYSITVSQIIVKEVKGAYGAILTKCAASHPTLLFSQNGSSELFISDTKSMISEPAFRGCAGAPYALDEKCNHRVQAVSVSATSNVDVDVHLCYCNSDVCNQDLSGAQRATTKARKHSLVKRWLLLSSSELPEFIG